MTDMEQNMSSTEVEIQTEDGGTMPAYVVHPQTGNGGAVVVLQEIFGVNVNIRGIADGLARDGYIAIAPDLFWRQSRGVQLDPAQPDSYEKASALLKGLDPNLALSDAYAAVEYVSGLSGISGGVGIVGYCLGGKLAFLVSGRPKIAATAVYYGTGLHTVLDHAANIDQPMLIHVAEKDHLCPPDAQQAIAAAFSDKDNVTVLTYPEGGHAFARRNGSHYEPDSAARADAATADFFARHLRADR